MSQPSSFRAAILAFSDTHALYHQLVERHGDDAVMVVGTMIEKAGPSMSLAEIMVLTQQVLDAGARLGWQKLAQVAQAAGAASVSWSKPASVSDPLLPKIHGPQLGRPLPKVLDEIEGDWIRKAMQQARGNKLEAAHLLGIKPTALHYKLEKYGIKVFDTSQPAQPTPPLDPELKAKLDREVNELEMSNRAAKVLAGGFGAPPIRYIGELVQQTTDWMWKHKGCGQKTLKELKKLLTAMGLAFGMKVEGWTPPTS